MLRKLVFIIFCILPIKAYGVYGEENDTLSDSIPMAAQAVYNAAVDAAEGLNAAFDDMTDSLGITEADDADSDSSGDSSD